MNIPLWIAALRFFISPLRSALRFWERSLSLSLCLSPSLSPVPVGVFELLPGKQKVVVINGRGVAIINSLIVGNWETVDLATCF